MSDRRGPRAAARIANRFAETGTRIGHQEREPSSEPSQLGDAAVSELVTDTTGLSNP